MTIHQVSLKVDTFVKSIVGRILSYEFWSSMMAHMLGLVRFYILLQALPQPTHS